MKIGGLLLVLGAVVTSSAGGCGRKTGAPEEGAPAPPPRPKRKVDFERFRDSGLGRAPYGIDPIDEAKAAETWHVRLYAKDGVVSKVERVAPTGMVFNTWTYAAIPGKTPADSGLLIEERDVWDNVVATTRLMGDGVSTKTVRAGSVLDFGCHHRKLDFDARGRTEKLTCLDAAERVVPDYGGCEVRVYEHDEKDRRTAERCFHPDGSKAFFFGKQHEQRYVYDADGRLVEIDALDDAGKKTLDLEGCALRRNALDAAGNRVRQLCRDVAGTIVRDLRSKWDGHACKTKDETLDAAGAPLARQGVATTLYGRDERCGLLSFETHDTKGALAGKIPKHTYRLDVHGDLASEECFDAKEKPISCQDGRASVGVHVDYVRDEHGRIVSRKGFDAKGAPSALSFDYPHERRSEYGPDGFVAKDVTYDAAGKKALGLGFAEARYVFDSLGAELSRTFYDLDGNKVASTPGCHEQRNVFDEHHRLTTKECRGVDGALHATTMCQDAVCWKGAATVTVDREDGKLENVFLDVGGKELRRIACDTEPCYR